MPVNEPVKGMPPGGGIPIRLFHGVVSSLNAIGSFWIFFLMVIINLDAFGRTLFAAPIYGVNEIVELSLVGIVFLQLADATRSGRLTRSDGFFSFLLRRTRLTGRLIGAAFELIGIVFMVIILFGSVQLLTEAYTENFYVGEEGLATFPVWPVKLVVVVGCAVTLLQFASFGYRYLLPDSRETSATAFTGPGTDA